MADKLDDLLRAADKGAPIGASSRYYKTQPDPAKLAPPATKDVTPSPAPVEGKPGESEKDVIDRVLGRGRSSMSDAPDQAKAGEMYAAAQGTRVLLPSGQVAEFPPEMSQAEIEAAVRKFLGVPEPKAAEPEKKAPSFLDRVRSEWAKTKKAEEELKSPVIKAVEAVTPSATTAASTVATAGGGALGAKLLSSAPKLGAALGRVGTGAAITAGKEIANTGGVGWETVIDAAIGGGTEAVPGALGKLLKKPGAPVRGFRYATEAPEKALDYVKSRLATTRMVIPSIDPAKKITWDEAISALKKMTGDQYRTARAEIAAWMNKADRQVIGPKAGAVFKDRTAKFRVPPSSTAKMAEGARQTIGANVPRAAADEAATTQDEYGVPLGYYAWQALKGEGGHLMDKIKGPFLRAAEHVIP